MASVFEFVKNIEVKPLTNKNQLTNRKTIV